MLNKHKVDNLFWLIIVVAIAAALVTLPKVPEWVPMAKWFTDRHLSLGIDLQGGSHLVYQTDTANVPVSEREKAVEGTRDVIERRINYFGVAEPIVRTNKSADEWRIIVELPGIKNIEDAKKMIGETPVLEFKEEDEKATVSSDQQKEIDDYNKNAQARIYRILNEIEQKKTTFEVAAKQYSEDPGSGSKSGELGWFRKGMMVQPFEDEVIRLQKGEMSKDPIQSPFGYHIVRKNDERGEGDQKEYNASHVLIKTKKLEASANPWKNTQLSGKHLKIAGVSFNPSTGQPEVSLEFNEEGSKLFGEITTRNVNKPVAIFLDSAAISVPRVQEPITSGRAVITGDFSVQEAKLLAQRLSAGALPIPIKLISQNTIGAQLGKEAVDKSIKAGIIGIAAIILFMILFYRTKGIVASISLIIYLVLSIALFKIVGVTMTLAGIAGFIISLGMAVDANVLIFERMKEEMNKGSDRVMALEFGFDRAWSAIRDSNVTTLITCAILYYFGSSLLRGFGLTLGVGVIVSMFTAITVTRVFLQKMYVK